MMKYFFVSLFLLPLFAIAQQQSKTKIEFSRKEIKEALSKKDGRQILVDNVIPDIQTAISVAEQILFKIYGKEHIIGERPYQISLVDGYWILDGSLPKDSLGGTFHIILSSKDGRVIKLIHYK